MTEPAKTSKAATESAALWPSGIGAGPLVEVSTGGAG